MVLYPEPDDLDRALAAARVPGDVIRLGPGVYPTRGCWAHADFISLASGVRIEGAGRDETIIQLSQNAQRDAAGVLRPDRDLHVLWGGDDVALTDLTIDGNEHAFRSSDPASEWFVAGCRFHGRFRMERVAIRRIRGAWKPQGTVSGAVEVFAVSSIGNTGGSLVQDVLVDTIPASSYVSGIFIGSTTDVQRQSHVVRCSVQLGADNQFGFAANRLVSFAGCECSGGRYGFYNDTGPTTEVDLAASRLAGSWAAVSVVAKDATGIRTGVRISDCRLHGERGLEIWDRSGAGVAADVSCRTSRISANLIAAVANRKPCAVTIDDCTVDPDARCYTELGSARAALRRCRLRDGTLIPDSPNA